MIGVKTSAIINRCLVILTVVILSFIIVAGATKADIQNWRTTNAIVNLLIGYKIS